MTEILSNSFARETYGGVSIMKSQDFSELQKLCLSDDNYDMCLNVAFINLGHGYFLPSDSYMYVTLLGESFHTKYLLTSDLTPVDDLFKVDPDPSFDSSYF
jgi:hypothetical protein